jgi:excisionase family DNA binding protein
MNNMKLQESTAFADYPDIMSVHQVRQALHIGRTAVYRLLESNELRCFKIGNAYKIPKSSLVEFVRRNSSGG